MAVPNGLILWPIRFAATSYQLRVTINGVTSNLNFPRTGSLTVGRNYWMSGDGQADSDGGVGGVGDLLAILDSCIEGHGQAPVVTSVLNATTWRIETTIDDSPTSSTHTILWSSGSTTLNEAIFGHSSDTTAGPAQITVHTSPNVPQGIWRPRRPVSEDSRNRRPILGGLSRSLAGQMRISNFGTPARERAVTFERLHQNVALTEYLEGTNPTGSFEYAWLNSLALGRPFRFYTDEGTRTSSSYLLARAATLEEPLERSRALRIRWDVELPMVEVI